MENDPERSFREMADLQYLLNYQGWILKRFEGTLKNMDKLRSTMSLPKEKKRSLYLDKDLALTKEDLAAIETPQPHDPRDLGSYLDFLDEVWGSKGKGTVKKFFSEVFQLDRRNAKGMKHSA